MAKINIKESLLNLDKETYCKYDLTTMYENCNITEKDKEKLAKILSENVSTEKVHNYLLERFIQDKNKFVDDLQECDKLFVKEDLSDTNEYNYLNTESIYKEIQSKQIPDMDGFMTDYTWYLREPDKMNVFVYGDKEYYKPEDGYFDYETENSQEAREWFYSYNGFEDDDSLYEGTIKTSKGKWTNKGEEGTHGTFDTKKEADAQRKAMFVSGYKGESLKEDWLEDTFVDKLWNILEDVSGIESIDYDADDSMQNIITFGSSGDLNKRLDDIEQAFKNAGVKYEEVATNGNNVIVIKVDKSTLKESLEGKDGSFTESKESTNDELKQDLIKLAFTPEDSELLIKINEPYAENIAYGNTTTEDIKEAQEYINSKK